LENARNLLENLTSEIDDLRESLNQWEGCECSRYCIEDGKRVRNGTNWEKGREDCQCVNGNTICTCKKLNCYQNQSEYTAEGDKCPTCQNDCIEGSKRYRHGQKVKDYQTTCTCFNNKLINCERIQPTDSRFEEVLPPNLPSQLSSKSCSRCCSNSTCIDSDGYCMCECSQSDFSCSRCNLGQTVNPKTKSCHKRTKHVYSNLSQYKTLIEMMY
jgi:hypothetical protein